MNQHISAQILNMTTMVKTFNQSCRMAALKDDGTIDRNEQKMLDKINKASERFIKDLEAVSR